MDFGLGAASNFVSTLINQAFARRNAEMNYQYGQRAADADFQRKLTFFDIQNKYNSPASQVQRRLQAGLSPFESVDSGNSQGLDTAITPNQVGLRGPIDFDASIDLLDSMRTFSEINMMAKNGGKIDQEIANMLKQEYLLGLEAELKKLGKTELVERINNIIADTSLKSSNANKVSLDNFYQSLINKRTEYENAYVYTRDYYKKLGENYGYDLDNDNMLKFLENTPVGKVVLIMERLVNLINPLSGLGKR